MRFIDYKDGNRMVEDKPITFNNHWILVHQTPDTVGWSIGDTFFAVEVYPETVGQFTGLKDKNGVNIYEGDKLRGFQKEQDDKEGKRGFEITDTVYWHSGGFNVFSKSFQSAYARDNNILYQFMWRSPANHVGRDHYYQIDDIETIGNIHELTPAKGAVNYNMNNNFDPNSKQAEESAANAQESASQDTAMEVDESAEEGGTEG